MVDQLLDDLLKTGGLLARGFSDHDQRVVLVVLLDKIMKKFIASVTLLEVFTFGTLLLE